jgi:replicative DNA helicase
LSEPTAPNGAVENVGDLSKSLLMTLSSRGRRLPGTSPMLEEITSDKTLPQNLEAERSVLGAILLDPSALSFVVPVISQEDFFPDTHRRIYGAMLELSQRSAEIDILTLKEELDRTGAIEKAGGAAYLTALLDGVPDVGNVEHYARIVKEKATLRRLIRAGQKIVRDGFASKEAMQRLVLAQSKIHATRFFVDDSAALNVPEMRAKAQRLKREKGLDLLMVDYMQLMAGHGRFDNRTQEVSMISRGLKLLAKELRVPIIALSQLSRQPEQRKGELRKPQLADLRDSGSIEQDADVVVFLYREELYDRETERKGIADVIIAKQRNGPTGDFPLVFLGDHMTFANYAGGPPAFNEPPGQPF